jgi:precorrin-6B methylase 2
MAVATKYQENLIRVDVYNTYTHEHACFIPKNRDWEKILENSWRLRISRKIVMNAGRVIDGDF